MTVRAVLIAAATALLGAAVSAGSADATPADGDVVRTDVAKGVTDAPVAINTGGEETAFYVQNLLLRPTASSGWHTHPGPEFSVVTTGTVELQTGADCALTRYGQGQAVFIPAGVPHRVANSSAGDAEVVVTYTVPVDAAVRGDSPDVCEK
ncbi:MAG: cupin domain-containing protein [Mycobacterium sp.]